jgi:hypothetical protein
MWKWLTMPLAAVLIGCASAPEVPMRPQPGLAAAAMPYADALRSVGIVRIRSPGGGAMVRLDTYYGAVYLAYPAGVPGRAFVVELGDAWITGEADAFDAATYRRLFDALVPEAVRRTADNNAFEWARANPVN